MVNIVINGKKNGRVFQNMGQALVFANQNGDCRNAEKLELAYVSKAKEMKRGKNEEYNAEKTAAEKQT